MDVNEKLALADLLRVWRQGFGNYWVKAQDAVAYLSRDPHYRDSLNRLGITSGDGDELSKQLDEVRDRAIYNFVVKRNVSYTHAVTWRVLLQDNRVEIADEERDDFLALRKGAGLKIDPATAEVEVSTGSFFDPYGVEKVPEEYRGYSPEKLYWARAPGSDIWVSFHDLPDETRTALWDLLRRQEPHREQAFTVGDKSPRSAA